MGIGRRLAGNRPESEALGRVISRALQLAVVIYERFGLPVFEEQFAVVGRSERIAQDLLAVGGLQFGKEPCGFDRG